MNRNANVIKRSTYFAHTHTQKYELSLYQNVFYKLHSQKHTTVLMSKCELNLTILLGSELYQHQHLWFMLLLYYLWCISIVPKMYKLSDSVSAEHPFGPDSSRAEEAADDSGPAVHQQHEDLLHWQVQRLRSGGTEVQHPGPPLLQHPRRWWDTSGAQDQVNSRLPSGWLG